MLNIGLNEQEMSHKIFYQQTKFGVAYVVCTCTKSQFQKQQDW